MMTNKDRDYNRNLKDCSPLRGVHYDFGLRLELQSKSNLEYFEISVLHGCDIVGLHSIKAELYQNMKILVMLEHEVLQEHLAIPQSELRRNEFKFNENLFKVAKDEIRTKIKLTDIYLSKVWKDMEYHEECHEASTHFEDYMNQPSREPDPCEVPDYEGNYNCPFNSNGPDDCRRHCGLGVDE